MLLCSIIEPTLLLSLDLARARVSHLKRESVRSMRRGTERRVLKTKKESEGGKEKGIVPSSLPLQDGSTPVRQIISENLIPPDARYDRSQSALLKCIERIKSIAPPPRRTTHLERVSRRLTGEISDRCFVGANDSKSDELLVDLHLVGVAAVGGVGRRRLPVVPVLKRRDEEAEERVFIEDNRKRSGAVGVTAAGEGGG